MSSLSNAISAEISVGLKIVICKLVHGFDAEAVQKCIRSSLANGDMNKKAKSKSSANKQIEATMNSLGGFCIGGCRGASFR